MNSKFKDALNYFKKGQLDESKKIFLEILEKEQNNFDVYFALGIIFFKQKEYSKSEDFLNKGIKIKPKNVEIYNLLAIVLLHLKKFDLAIDNWNIALKLKPNYLEAYNNLGNLFFELGRNEEALNNYRRALEINPDFAEAYNNQGNVLLKLKKIEDALKSYQKALEIKPDYVQAYHNCGQAYFEKKQLGEALKCYEKALNYNPDFAEAHFDKGNIFVEQDNNEAAIECFQKALRLKPEFENKLGMIIHQKQRICDWNTLDQDIKKIENKILQSEKLSSPFFFLSINNSLNLQKILAEKWFRNEFALVDNVFEPNKKNKVNKKIKIGYYSADFREHAVGQLMVNLFELHDKSKFEVIAFYFGPVEDDIIKKRILLASNKFIDVSLKTEKQISKISRELEIDIAVDLMGYTKKNRFKIFSERSAPLQVSYLGYPGTTGANCIDYLIADKFLISKNEEKYYSEKIIYLPNSYMVNKLTKKKSEKILTRKEFGIPEESFVFCCFNQSYKILPQIFDIWMKILKRVDGSVLWLSQTNKTSKKNLLKEAATRDIKSNRIIFSSRLQIVEEYLDRFRLADLFLDTFPYTAHSICSDSLKSGLPVLTLKGETFASRVSSSFLKVLELEELVVNSIKEYEDRAVELANDLSKLKNVKNKLDINKNKSPLFDTKLFTKHIEQAYIEIYKKYNENLKPDTIYLKNV
tara:strand:+ start:1632 stop:3716 length:2085 start_codon:yes stop_codon:yes gene_type:complete